MVVQRSAQLQCEYNSSTGCDYAQRIACQLLYLQATMPQYLLSYSLACGDFLDGCCRSIPLLPAGDNWDIDDDFDLPIDMEEQKARERLISRKPSGSSGAGPRPLASTSGSRPASHVQPPDPLDDMLSSLSTAPPAGDWNSGSGGSSRGSAASRRPGSAAGGRGGSTRPMKLGASKLAATKLSSESELL